MDDIKFKDHLQEVLDSVVTDTFIVSSTRDNVGRTDKINVVFTPLSGSVFANSESVPYQVEIFTTKPDETINLFKAIAKTRNNKSFISVVETEEGAKEYTVFEFYTTPAVAEKNLEFGTNLYVRLVMFVTLNVFYEVGNVSGIKIDGEEIEFTNGSISYSTEMFSNRKSGEDLNFAIKKASTTNLQFQMVNKSGIFTNAIMNIMFGKLNGKTKFLVEVRLTTGFTGTLTMILNQNVFSFAKNTPNLPSFNITLTNSKA